MVTGKLAAEQEPQSLVFVHLIYISYSEVHLDSADLLLRDIVDMDHHVVDYFFDNARQDLALDGDC